MEVDEGFRRLDAAFEGAIAPWRGSSDPVVVLFSGGVDSGVIATALRRSPAVTLFTVGTARSADLQTAEVGAALLGLPWVSHEVLPSEVQDVLARIERDPRDLTATARSVQTSFALAVANAPPGGLLCGQGADELFLGYAHFRGLNARAASLRADSDLRTLVEREWPRSVRIARALGRSIFAPYLDPKFVAVARSIRIELRQPGARPKGFFRDWAETQGVPAAIAQRPKRALQYGSGIDRLLARIGPRLGDRTERRSLGDGFDRMAK